MAYEWDSAKKTIVEKNSRLAELERRIALGNLRNMEDMKRMAELEAMLKIAGIGGELVRIETSISGANQIGVRAIREMMEKLEDYSWASMDEYADILEARGQE